jgi:serralysin
LLGSAKTYYFAFPTALPTYASSTDAKGWQPFTAVQQQRAVDALTYIGSIVDLNFSKTTIAAASNTIIFSNNDQSGNGSGSAGYASYPSAEFYGGDLYLDNSSSSPSNATISDGTYGALTLIHELGHALGLKHPFAGKNKVTGEQEPPPSLSATEDKTAYTVMSYTYSSAEYYLRFSVLDIAALQYLYGPSKTARTANDTYSISTTGTNFIWDGAGADTITAAACNQGCTIYLTPGYWGYVGSSKAAYITGPGQITVNFGTTIENLIGSGYADTLVGNEVGNSISGGSGNDTITGGAGNDTLDGGDGADVVVFSGPLSAYSLLAPGSDQIRVTDGSISRDGVDVVTGFEVFRFADGDRTKAQILALTVPPGVNWIGTGADDTYVGGAGNDTISGLAGNDLLSGGAGNDSIIGGLGNDTLDGGAGADTLIGGLGDDVYVVDDLLDTVTELAAEGKDTVQTTLPTYTLGPNVENWVALGVANLSANGNALNNVLTGNAGNNTIYGGGGDDTILEVTELIF